jgi:hypothetical protein
MEIVVRVIAADLPEAGTTLAGPGLLVSALCALVFLALGLANYAGYGKFIATAYILSPFVILALAWLGGGGLLVLVGAWLASLGTVGTVVGVLVAALGALAWVVGVVGLFWMPPRLRPRWMRDLLARRKAGDDVHGGVRR